jgi:branched-chain amino acid aminotransferase
MENISKAMSLTQVCSIVLFSMEMEFSKVSASLESHLKRLQLGITDLQLDFSINLNYFKESIHELSKRNKFYSDARLKIMLYRTEGGYYTPNLNTAELLMYLEALPYEGYAWNEQGKNIDILPQVQIHSQQQVPYKKIGAQSAQIKAAQFKKEWNLDDVILTNERGEIVEAISSNIIILKDQMAIAPEDNSGHLPGVMLQHILSLLQEQGIEVYRKNFHPHDLQNADEIILCNAIEGVSYVKSLKSKRFFKEKAKLLQQLLNKHITS